MFYIFYIEVFTGEWLMSEYNVMTIARVIVFDEDSEEEFFDPSTAPERYYLN